MSMGDTCMACGEPVPATGRKWCLTCNPLRMRRRRKVAQRNVDIRSLVEENRRLRAELAIRGDT